MSHLTLYRKYRPQTFAELVNQEHIKSTIQQEIKSGQLPHAFLFHGPRGVGKTTMARILAKALNCKKRGEKDADPCNKCESCKAMTAGASLSLIEVDAASQTGVDNVRDNIIANARLAVKSDEFKVFIIDEVHMLSTSSFNALLKTLEEPPERVLFILATTEIQKIPTTIISRCQRFDFHTAGVEVLKEHLASIVKKEKREVEADVIAAIVKKSGGYIRDALSVLGQVLTLSGKITAQSASLVLPMTNYEDLIEFFEIISQGRTADAMVFIQKQEQLGYRPYHFTQGLIDFARNMLLKVVGSHPDIFKGEVVPELESQIDVIAKCYSPRQLLGVMDVLMKRLIQLKQFDQGSLPLELAVIELTQGEAEVVEPSTLAVSATQTASPAAQSVPTIPVAPHSQMPAKSKLPPVSEASVIKAGPVVVDSVVEEKVVPASEAASEKAVQAPVQTAEQENGSEVLKTENKEQNPCSFNELEGVWGKIMDGVGQDHHSLKIILKSAKLRQQSNGMPELAFQFAMHHDHVKRSMEAVVKEVKKHLPEKRVSINLVVDAQLSQEAAGDVVEPQQEEKDTMSDELSKLADAFGGAVVE